MMNMYVLCAVQVKYTAVKTVTQGFAAETAAISAEIKLRNKKARRENEIPSLLFAIYKVFSKLPFLFWDSSQTIAPAKFFDLIYFAFSAIDSSSSYEIKVEPLKSHGTFAVLCLNFKKLLLFK